MVHYLQNLEHLFERDFGKKAYLHSLSDFLNTSGRAFQVY